MSLAPYQSGGGGMVTWAYDLANTLLFRGHYLYYWLRDVAPVLVKYRLKQLGRQGIDRLPLLSWQMKQEIKRWLKDYSIL